jgi:hypothetical protein
MKKVRFKEAGYAPGPLNVVTQDVHAHVDEEKDGSCKLFKLIRMEWETLMGKPKYSYAWLEVAMNEIRHGMHGHWDAHVALMQMIEHCDYVGEDLYFTVQSPRTKHKHLTVEVCEREYGTLLVNNDTN